MKKILNFGLVLAFACALTTVKAQQGYRFSVVPGSDNTYAIPHKEISAKTYTATLTLTPNAEETTYIVSALTGACTFNLSTSKAYTGDRVYVVFTATTSTRTVTWGSNIAGNASTLAVTTSKPFAVCFVFSGSKWTQITNL